MIKGDGDHIVDSAQQHGDSDVLLVEEPVCGLWRGGSEKNLFIAYVSGALNIIGVMFVFPARCGSRTSRWGLSGASGHRQP
jgi:hypothetical protein